MKRIGVTILVFSTLLIQSCSITGLTTGIIINSRSFEEIPVHEDTLQALPSDNEIKVTLQGGKNHYGKFLKVEILEDNENITLSNTNGHKDSTSNQKAMIGDWSISIEMGKEILRFTNEEVEKISVYQKNYAPIIGFTIGLMIDFMIFHNIHLDFGPH